MGSSVRYLAIVFGATTAIACGGWVDRANNGFGSDGSAYGSPREAVGTSGSMNDEITIRGCVARMQYDDYVLTDVTGTGDGEAVQPLSAEGDLRLTGKSDQFVAHVDREVEIKGFLTDDRSGSDTLRVASMRSTGRKCPRS